MNSYKSPYLTSGEYSYNTRKITDEIVEIVERVGCCTLSQLLDYINTYHAQTPNLHTSHIFGLQEVFNLLSQMRGTIRIQEPSDVTVPKLKRLVYSTRYSNRDQINKETTRYGIAKMAAIIPFLPQSRAVYDVKMPGISFIFMKDDMQIEVSVISHGQETTTCSVLDRMPVPKSVDINKLLRIAIVEDTASAYDIVGGGFVSVCIINAENKLQQVRTIDRNEAWSAIAPTT